MTPAFAVRFLGASEHHVARIAIVLGHYMIFTAALLGALSTAPGLHAQPVAPVAADDFTLGDRGAEVTVIEYASASCPHCARFNNEVFAAFKAKYIDTRRVYFVYRPILTQPIEVAAAGALLTGCAQKGRAFAVVDAFFKGQQHMYEAQDLRGVLLSAGQAGGLTEAQVLSCLNDKTATDALDARVKRYLKDDKIQGSPTFVIGDQRLDGEQTLASLDDAIGKAEALHSAGNPSH